MVLTDDSTISTPPASPVSHYAQTTAGGAIGYSTANSSGVSVVPHATLSHRGSAGSAASVSSYGSSAASSSKGLSSGVSVSTGLIGRITRVSGTAFGGGGGVSSGGGGGGSRVSAGSGVSRGSSGSGGSGGFGGGIAIAVAAPAQGGVVSVVPVVGNRNYFATQQGEGVAGTPEVYGEDAPGVIVGESAYDVETNSNVDNTIVSSYGQPIGDALWPLLLMAMVYVLWLALARSLCARR